MSCNFGLKSYLWFQIELALRARSILKSRVWFQPKLHSTQFNYHYLSWSRLHDRWGYPPWQVAWSARYRVTLSAGVTICHVNVSKWGNPPSRGQKAQKRDMNVLKICTFLSRFIAEITRNRNGHTGSIKCTHFGIFSAVYRPYLVSQTIPCNVISQRFLAKPNTT